MRRLASFVILLCTTGCFPQPDPVIADPDPMVKIPAMKLAVDRHDAGAAKDLIRDLNSDDAAIRFYAITALQRLTGDDFGYHYYDDEDQRKAAVGRWQEWLAKQPQQSPKK